METIAAPNTYWTVADLREALASPDLPEDAVIEIRIDMETEAVATRHIWLGLSRDRKRVTLGDPR